MNEERHGPAYRGQFNPDLTLSEAVVEEWIPWEHLEQRENRCQARVQDANN